MRKSVVTTNGKYYGVSLLLNGEVKWEWGKMFDKDAASALAYNWVQSGRVSSEWASVMVGGVSVAYVMNAEIHPDIAWVQ